MHAEPVIATAPRRKLAPPTRSAFTVDVEEWFHAEAFAGCISRRGAQVHRAEPYIEQIAQWLAETGNRATFFVLGRTVAYLAPLLRRLAAAGHELACHGYAHEHLARLSPAALRADLRRARAGLEDALGQRVWGYRAPTFSITPATAWALDVITEEGFEYDASIFPIRHDRYGVPAAPLEPFWAVAPGGARLLEFPPLTLRCGPLRIPVGGGGYLRLWPGVLLRRALAHQAARGKPALVYIHPWELDRARPPPPLPWRARWRHRVGTGTAGLKVRGLLRAFRFDTAAAVLTRVRARELPVFALRPTHSAGAPTSWNFSTAGATSEIT
jgi:polysaccharide deacetylase family protein (PEP-CTERM system associated)